MNTPRVERKRVSFWTDEKKATAKRLYIEEDKSASITGNHLGVTRNAIIGIIHRMGLKKKEKEPLVREPRAKKKYVRARTAADKVARRAEGPAPVPIRGEDLLTAQPLLASVLELNDSRCAYPYGTSNFQFCGRKRTRGAFCEAHASLCYNELAYRPR